LSRQGGDVIDPDLKPHGASRWGQRLLRALEPYQADDLNAAKFRARQLQAVLRLAPLTMLANAVNVMLIVWAFWPTAPRAFLLAWGSAVVFAVWRGLKAWHRWRHSASAWTRASRRALHRSTLNAALLASIWAMLPLTLFTDSDGSHQLLLAAVSTGMICAGGFALATTPLAGTAWVVVLGSSAALALFRAHFAMALPVSLLLTIYSLIVVASVWSTARLFGSRMMAEAESERQNDVIGLLLRDFEENASDVLFEVDADGRMCHVSPRLEGLLGLSASQLQSSPVIDWLEKMRCGDDARAEIIALRHAVGNGQAFRDLPLTTTNDGISTHWQISAKPLVDSSGRLRGWRGVGTDVSVAQRATRQLAWLAHFDALTSVANRHQFRAALANLLTVPRQGQRVDFALLCIDLDHFKAINDTLGHGAGDALLQEIAARLRTGTRRTDTVARLGGDEFAVLLQPVGSKEDVEVLAARLLASIASACDVQGSRVMVRASIGVAMAPVDGDDIDTLLGHADLALYAAKSAGRGEIRFFSPEMAAKTKRRLLVEQSLRSALVNGELSLAYQPQLDVRSGRITGFEALLRWQHPALGAMSPAEFIPLAEESGQIIEMGEWVLQEACRAAATWPGELTVSVNVSPVQAMSQGLRCVVLEALSSAKLPATRLELEITESIFLNDAETTLALLHGLRTSGVQIALDDFGTGYSSLAYLRRFPFDTLKIDQSFVKESMERPDARAIVKMIVGLACTLDMKTVAEGVEQQLQAELLTEHGCSVLQGYLISRPMPGSEVVGWLAGWEAGPLHSTFGEAVGRSGLACVGRQLSLCGALAADD
jgi:diguanylate cyclase (GGDEF)-like protein/PAS domain S-box-containing protein